MLVMSFGLLDGEHGQPVGAVSALRRGGEPISFI